MMRESVAQRQRAIGRFPFVDELHERMLALEPFQPVLDFVFAQLQRRGHERRVEVETLHARRAEQPSVIVIERFELPLDGAAYRLRQLAFERGEIRRQPPAAVGLHDDRAAAQVAHQVGHEQRIAFGALVQHRGERLRKCVLRKTQRQISGQILDT